MQGQSENKNSKIVRKIERGESAMNITVAGTGYVGLSNAILLAQHNAVTAVDVLKQKVDLINQRKSPIADKEIQEYLQAKDLNLKAVADEESEPAYREADLVIIATPTNYDPCLLYTSLCQGLHGHSANS